ncbi:phosphoglycerate kinase, partial [Clostridioides difficile]
MCIRAMSDHFAPHSPPIVTEDANVKEDYLGLGIGPKTIANFVKPIKESKTVVWNRPMGVFVFENFANCTLSVARAMADLTDAT